ncbi:MAG: dienelactone hydrolase family protein [Armatimonadota bacterium]
MLNLNELCTPPPEYDPQALALADLEIGETLSDWETRREELRERWLDFLGFGPQQVPLNPEVHGEEHLGDITRLLISYNVEENCRAEAFLLKPADVENAPGVVVFHPTHHRTIMGPAGISDYPTKHFAKHLAKRGYVALCPRNYLFDYRDMMAKSRSQYVQIVDYLLKLWPQWTGMGKMLWDGMRAVDYLQDRPEVDADRIGCIGHSLGAKEALYLTAFDDRVEAGVSSEGGLGIPFSNWSDRWYLGEAITDRDDLQHHQLVAMCAPRALLVIGGGLQPTQKSEDSSPGADPIEDWNYMEAARPVYELYDRPENLGLFLHNKGHFVPPEAEDIIYPWMDYFLKGDSQ